MSITNDTTERSIFGHCTDCDLALIPGLNVNGTPVNAEGKPICGYCFWHGVNPSVYMRSPNLKMEDDVSITNDPVHDHAEWDAARQALDPFGTPILSTENQSWEDDLDAVREAVREARATLEQWSPPHGYQPVRDSIARDVQRIEDRIEEVRRECRMLDEEGA